jgi:hypothetical protein
MRQSKKIIICHQKLVLFFYCKINQGNLKTIREVK